MRLPHRLNRIALVLTVAALAVSAGGCKLFGKKSELYTRSVESRPLEVPPDLDRPAADRAMTLPDTGGSVSASGMNNAGGSSAAPIGFNASGDRDAIFARVGEVLGTTAGVSVVNRAQILGT